MKKLSVAIFIYLLLTSGCAVSRSNHLGDKVVYDIKSVIYNIDPIRKISPHDAIKIGIDLSSPKIDSSSTKGRFEIFEVAGDKNQSYFISATGVCDCLGFRKEFITPVVYLLDQNGDMVASGSPAGGKISQYVSGKFPESGKYYLLVVADDRLDGQRIGQIGDPPDKFKILAIPFFAQNTGTVMVNWQE
ncbi:MAG: hypothetical protein LBE62_11935 [Azonexus sp.]|jgi:hypothetical protein|nr:hypothetical protein [Azonexus sp.]